MELTLIDPDTDDRFDASEVNSAAMRDVSTDSYSGNKRGSLRLGVLFDHRNDLTHVLSKGKDYYCTVSRDDREAAGIYDAKMTTTSDATTSMMCTIISLYNDALVVAAENIRDDHDVIDIVEADYSLSW